MILIIGATGMLGQALLKQAGLRNINILGTSRQPSAAVSFTVDLTDLPAVDRLLSNLQPSHIINCAAITNSAECEAHPEVAFNLHSHAVQWLVQSCDQHKAKLIQISTDQVGEDNAYAMSKAEGEKFALINPNNLVIRTNVTGLRRWTEPTFFEWAYDAIKEERELTLFTNAFCQTIDSTSLADAIFDLIECNGLLEIGSSEIFSKSTFLHVLANRMGIGLPSYTETPTPAYRRLLDVRKAEILLGHKLPTLLEVINALLASVPNR